MNRCLAILLLFVSLIAQGQNRALDSHKPVASRFLFGVQAGSGWACIDETHLFNLSLGPTIDYQIADHLYFQLAPSYTWLWQLNEHYLILPIHLSKKFGEVISIYAGPALTVNFGSYKEMGASAGATIHLDNRFALVLSLYAFTLYDNDITYRYVPINISYRYTF